MSIGKNDFLNDMQYADGITIIDTFGNILFSVKFNPAFNPDKKDDNKDVIGKKLCEAFPNIKGQTSTLMRAMELGKPVYSNRQGVMDEYGNTIFTKNISVPLKANDRIIGAIEVSKDLSKQSLNNVVIMTPDEFKGYKPMDKRLYSNKAHYTLEDIISGNKDVLEQKEFIKKIKDISAPVFIYGETGTGKELFAHAIHNASNRAERPFITQNCAAIPENLLESILFGTTKGSFTGAYDNPGLFELAEGGTIFLDEINSMPIYLQSKLLRVLQDGYIRRLGDKSEKRVDVRVISAANLHPKECLRNGQLREDIYYRLSVLTLEMIPLRKRKDDIQILLNFFINEYNISFSKNIKMVSKEVYEYLRGYSWPGNVRELQHLVEYAMILVDVSENTIHMEHIENRTEGMANDEQGHCEVQVSPLNSALESVEKDMIERAVKLTEGNVSKAAKLLEIPRQTLQKKIIKYNIEQQKFCVKT
ncbi:sigma-54 interaction domain-containing protein [Aminipila sp.]|uniref:sigma-54 interaction domain-containing protein n=1 Tax=Aminipila sp. TaxID=2060095 RepID=UPI00289A7D67|nr:sigma 54-interacting transcriptional regulator [Aminipila sp.]